MEPGLRRQQARELQEWLQVAFKRFADLWGHAVDNIGPGETAEDSRIRIRRYGQRFVEIARGRVGEIPGADPDLPMDLYDLMQRNCPELDIVQFLLSCTSGHTNTVAARLKRYDITEQTLDKINEYSRWISDAMLLLNEPAIPGPLIFLKRWIPHKRERRHIRRAILNL